MDISGSYTLYAPRERVWAFLLDPARLRATIPGCEELETLGPGRYRMRLNVGVAAVKGVYSGTLTLWAYARLFPTTSRWMALARAACCTATGR